ncbi:type II toxin-antitoxin system VapB family antitoxin [Uliginosibacterium sediminicola]|uniref:Type II toxin-antitoxin system VapB family antitoxin n=1 Tax=Uliginosibacterium sediminicola TaxID=2024550 RepID=A0ABU9Z0C3_9RHOO
MQITAKLFANGRSQAVRLPKEFRFEGSEVLIEKQGDAVILRPLKKKKSWADVFAALDAFESDFVFEREQPAMQERPELEQLWSGK